MDGPAGAASQEALPVLGLRLWLAQGQKHSHYWGCRLTGTRPGHHGIQGWLDPWCREQLGLRGRWDPGPKVCRKVSVSGLQAALTVPHWFIPRGTGGPWIFRLPPLAARGRLIFLPRVSPSNPSKCSDWSSLNQVTVSGLISWDQGSGDRAALQWLWGWRPGGSS